MAGGHVFQAHSFSVCYLKFIRHYTLIAFNYFMNPLKKYKNSVGKFIVLIGVDGAGKSSAIEYLEKNSELIQMGLKSIYFGNNRFWIPGLDALSRAGKANIIAKVLFYVLSRIDRQLRLILVLIFNGMGITVIGDRYFYDDEILVDLNNRNKNITRYLKWVLSPKPFIRPDVIIYLKVSPEIAYRRKQDYEFAIMLSVSAAYNHYFECKRGVVVVDSNMPDEAVKSKILSIVKDSMSGKSFIAL